MQTLKYTLTRLWIAHVDTFLGALLTALFFMPFAFLEQHTLGLLLAPLLGVGLLLRFESVNQSSAGQRLWGLCYATPPLWHLLWGYLRFLLRCIMIWSISFVLYALTLDDINRFVREIAPDFYYIPLIGTGLFLVNLGLLILTQRSAMDWLGQTEQVSAENGPPRVWYLLALRPLLILAGFLLIASLVLPYFGGTCALPKQVRVTQNMQKLKDMLEGYYADKGHYPSHLKALKAAAADSNDYFWQDIVNPFTGYAGLKALGEGKVPPEPGLVIYLPEAKDPPMVYWIYGLDRYGKYLRNGQERQFLSNDADF